MFLCFLPVGAFYIIEFHHLHISYEILKFGLSSIHLQSMKRQLQLLSDVRSVKSITSTKVSPLHLVTTGGIATEFFPH